MSRTRTPRFQTGRTSPPSPLDSAAPSEVACREPSPICPGCPRENPLALDSAAPLPVPFEPPSAPRERDLLRVIHARLNSLPGVHLDRVNVALARGATRAFRTAPPGFPDLIGCANGRALAIEVKSATGRQRPDQRQWQSRWEQCGGIYILARDIDATIARVKSLFPIGDP
jgi:hypothetical protein